MAFGKKSAPSCSVPCRILKGVVCVILFAAVVAALIGVYKTHVLTGSADMRLQFGTGNNSLAIIAVVVSLVAFMKQLLGCMGTCEVCSK